MEKIIRILLFTLTCLATTFSFAQSISEGKTVAVKNKNGVTIYYVFYKPNGVEFELAVTGSSEAVTVIIPKTVIYNKRTWKVTAIGYNAFRNCKGLKSVTIPEGVTFIEKSAFESCEGLKSVKLPSSLTIIGEEAFQRCSGLTNVIIPDGVLTIGPQSFQHCTGLININIPSSVTNIDEEAFYGCTSLKSVTIPSSVTSIGNDAFSKCDKLTHLTVRMKDGSTQKMAIP